MPEQCDPTSKRCFGPIIRGWRSNHLGAGGAVGWCTATVFSTVTRIGKLLQVLQTASILREFNGQHRDGVANPAPFQSLMDADLELGGVKSTLKTEIYHRLIKPQLEKESLGLRSLQHPDHQIRDSSELTSLSRIQRSSPSVSPSLVDDGSLSLPSYTARAFPASYSGILFGPPGTAKTSISTSIASSLGWNFVTIDTACFLSYGLQNIASRMIYVFDRLRALDRCIILFDEIEEFCLDRENPSLSMESRMLTTAMLTQLNDLRRQQSVIFIVATNRLRSFDAAVTRPGRFDMLLFVGTPNRDARRKRILAKLRSSGFDSQASAKVLATLDVYMDSQWDLMRFLTFAENEAFAAAVIERVRMRGGEVTEDDLASIVSAIESTATIRGAVRDEYCASETLSRI